MPFHLLCLIVRHQLDHHPLLLSLDYSDVHHTTPFKIFKSWSTHDDRRKLVSDSWVKNVCGTGMLRLELKLKNLNQVFQHWNQTVFGDVDRQVTLAMEEVNLIQHLLNTLFFRMSFIHKTYA